MGTVSAIPARDLLCRGAVRVTGAQSVFQVVSLQAQPFQGSSLGKAAGIAWQHLPGNEVAIQAEAVKCPGLHQVSPLRAKS